MSDHIAPEVFKAAMQSVAASVTVVTAFGQDEPVGITVSAFAPVSADPPIVLICIDKTAGSLDTLLRSEGFSINFLPQGAEDTALLFATRYADKFGSVEWDEPEVQGSGPVLDEAFEVFECRTVERTEMGDHWVMFGEVVEAVVRSGTPLVYLNRQFVDLPET
jgi:flavin reductase (DIM6/NTAB) family NADH-FMN oxidoreductase RutF